MTATDLSFVEDVVNEASKMVLADALGATRPAQTGAIGNALNAATLTGTLAPFRFQATITGDVPRTVTLARAPVGAGNAALLDARTLLEAAIRNASPNDPRYSNATVQLIGGSLPLS